jgi:hypothetical protein
MTRTTSATVSMSVNSTSCTEARIGCGARRDGLTVGQSSISRFLHHLNLHFKKTRRDGRRHDHPAESPGAELANANDVLTVNALGHKVVGVGA